MPDGYRIMAVLPAAEVNPDEPRRFLLYPGGTMPRIGVEISADNGRKRTVTVDPLTGMPRNEILNAGADASAAPAGSAVKSLSGGDR